MYGLHLFRFVLMLVLTNCFAGVYVFILNLLTAVDETQYMTHVIRGLECIHVSSMVYNGPYCN